MKQYIKSYVDFEATGGFSDTFTSQCLESGISLKNVRKTKNGISAEISLSDYAKLKKPAVKSGSRLKITDIQGLARYISFLIKNIGAVTSVIASLIVLLFLSGGIWRIELRGNETVYADELMNALSVCGVTYGTRTAKTDTDSVEQRLCEMFDGKIHWLSLNIEGSTALLEIKENPQETMKQSFGQPCNVVADFDGVIEYINVTGGTAKIQAGSAVRKGDLIISGVITSIYNTTALFEADGECAARHSRTISFDARDIECFAFSGEKHKAVLSAFSLSLPIGVENKNANSTFSYSENLSVNGIILPVKIEKEAYCTKQKINVGQKQKQLIAMENLFYLAGEQLKNTTILKTKYNISQSKATLVTDCIDFIGIQTAINIKE